jgi:hypothetical protein
MHMSVQVIIECAISFLLILIANLGPLSMKPVVLSPSWAYKSIDEVRSVPEFFQFNNSRSKQLHAFMNTSHNKRK